MCVCVEGQTRGWEPRREIPRASQARIRVLQDTFKCLCGSTQRRVLWVTVGLRGSRRRQCAHLSSVFVSALFTVTCREQQQRPGCMPLYKNVIKSTF